MTPVRPIGALRATRLRGHRLELAVPLLVALIAAGTPPARAGITILSPVGDAPGPRSVWPVGSEQWIQWTWADAGSMVSIEYSTNGTTWVVLTPAHPIFDGAYRFRPVPGPPTTTAHIRIRSLENPAIDDTAGPFTVSGLQFLSPSAGVTWTLGATQRVSFVAAGLPSNALATVWYSPGGGVYDLERPVATNLPVQDGVTSFDWVIESSPGFTRTPSATARLKVTAGGMQAVSALFVLNGIKVTSPVSGASRSVWPAGSAQSIRWVSSGAGVNVGLDYSTNGLTWTVLEPAYPSAAGAYLLNPMPGPPTATAYVRVRSTGTPAIANVAGPFTVSGLEIQSPSADAIWTLGATQQVSFAAAGLPSNTLATVWYSPDGVTYDFDRPVVTNLPVRDGVTSFDWIVESAPGLARTPSTAARLKVAAGALQAVSDSFVLKGLTILDPEEGELVVRSEGPVPIQWISAGLVGPLALSCTVRSAQGTVDLFIAPDVNPSASVYFWTIPPAAVGTNVTLTARSADGFKAVSAPFEILATPGIRIVSPRDHEFWAVGETNTIRWRKGGPMQNEFTVGFSPFPYAVTSVLATGIFPIDMADGAVCFYVDWAPVTNLPGPARIVVKHFSDPTISDRTEDFGIIPFFELEPVTNTLQALQPVEIHWTSRGAVAAVDLFYTTDPDRSPSSWSLINTDGPFTGVGHNVRSTYAWRPPNMATETLWLRVQDHAYARRAFEASTRGPFSDLGPLRVDPFVYPPEDVRVQARCAYREPDRAWAIHTWMEAYGQVIPEPGHCRVSIHDGQGRLIDTLESALSPADAFLLQWGMPEPPSWFEPGDSFFAQVTIEFHGAVYSTRTGLTLPPSRWDEIIAALPLLAEESRPLPVRRAAAEATYDPVTTQYQLRAWMDWGDGATQPVDACSFAIHGATGTPLEVLSAAATTGGVFQQTWQTLNAAGGPQAGDTCFAAAQLRVIGRPYTSIVLLPPPGVPADPPGPHLVADATYDGARFLISSWIEDGGTVMQTDGTNRIAVYDQTGALLAQLQTTNAGGGVFTCAWQPPDPPALSEWEPFLVRTAIRDGTNSFSSAVSMQAASTGPVTPALHYVSPTGGHVAPYTNRLQAARDIPSAVVAAAQGAAVLVHEGTYTSGAAIALEKGILLTSVHGPCATIVSGGHAHGCVAMDHPRAMIHGLTLRHGTAVSGGGVHALHGTVRACVIVSNEAAILGGGMWLARARAERCVVAHNRAVFDGGGIGCLWGLVQNCTVFNNAAARGGGLEAQELSAIRNTIIAGNHAAQDTNWHNRDDGIVYAHCCTQPDPGGSENITSDPVLNRSGHLTDASPCIDAGAADGAPAVDIDGEAAWDAPTHANRVSAVDIGADEFVDRDADAVPDHWEKLVSGTLTNMNAVSDADADGLRDRDEYRCGTDPHRGDTDGDGLGDGGEDVAGTDPLDRDSVLCIEACSLGPTSHVFSVTWQAVTGRVYVLYGSPDSASWSNLLQTTGRGPKESSLDTGGHRRRLIRLGVRRQQP